jgi:hypothetical protein
VPPYGYVYGHLQAQAPLLAFMGLLHAIGVFTLVAAPLVLLTKPLATKNRNSAGDGAGSRWVELNTKAVGLNRIDSFIGR